MKLLKTIASTTEFCTGGCTGLHMGQIVYVESIDIPWLGPNPKLKLQHNLKPITLNLNLTLKPNA